MLVKAGSTLLVPRAVHTQQDVAGHIAENATLNLAQEAKPLRKVSLKAGRQGNTVAAIARQYRVSPVQVAQWNGTTAQGHFRPGQSITLMLAAAPSAAAGPATVKASPKARPPAARAPASAHRHRAAAH
jgi:membrane-bound lytic murein transglycosylase D